VAHTSVYQQIDSQTEQTVKRLQRLCRQPSVSAQGMGLRECAELVRDLMSDIGFQAELVPLRLGPPVVYGELKSKSSVKTIVFYNHYDVQPPEPLELWESDPWAAEVREGKVYARGAADNKANIVSRLAAIEAFLKAQGDVPCNVKFVIEGEEEIGSPHFADFIQQHRSKLRGDGAIWEFGGLDYGDIPAVTLGLKGVCSRRSTPVGMGRAGSRSRVGTRTCGSSLPRNYKPSTESRCKKISSRAIWESHSFWQGCPDWN
jgi:acetylornithine deacetylase/succinyl-diaminopimelate desuccinylase-like protein